MLYTYMPITTYYYQLLNFTIDSVIRIFYDYYSAYFTSNLKPTCNTNTNNMQMSKTHTVAYFCLNARGANEPKKLCWIIKFYLIFDWPNNVDRFLYALLITY